MEGFVVYLLITQFLLCVAWIVIIRAVMFDNTKVTALNAVIFIGVSVTPLWQVTGSFLSNLA